MKGLILSHIKREKIITIVVSFGVGIDHNTIPTPFPI